MIYARTDAEFDSIWREMKSKLNDFGYREVKVSLNLKGRNKKVRSLALVLSKNKKVALKRNGIVYDLTIPPRTLVVLN
jgi:3-deoxy-D-manno-octulosonic-acid transferase